MERRTPSTDAGSTWGWQRNVVGIDGGLAALQDSTGAVQIQLKNLHGDIVATVDDNIYAVATNAYFEQTEYGEPRVTNVTNPGRYGWLGTEQRSNDALATVVLMGVRLYNTTTGRFLTPDPVEGGNENAYNYPNDPIQGRDTTGAYSYSFTFSLGKYHGKNIHPKDVLRIVVSNFRLFPIFGCGSKLQVGEVCRLAGFNPIRVLGIGLASFDFLSLPGHVEGANKKIRFGFGSGPGGRLHMTVTASGPDNTWCNRNRSCTSANKAFAKSQWAKFALNIKFYLTTGRRPVH